MPKGAAHGIMISVLDEIKMNDKNQVVLIDGSSYVAMPNSCQIQINGKRGVENGPYVVIYTIVNTSQVDEEVLCEPQKAYILHVHSRDSLIPTSSDLERTLIEKSISNVRYNHSKGNNIISFEKPLYPYVSPISGRNVMPSLVVKGSGEVFIDIDYQVSEESKINCEKRLEAMNEITSLIRIPVCDSDESFDKESFKAVSEAAKYILGIGRE
jgi:acetyl esterase/lipase